MIKLNSDDNTVQGIQPNNFPALANEIIKTGVVALDVSGNNMVRRNIENTEDEAYFFAGAKALDVRTPIILTGGNRSVNHMEKLLNTNEIDFIGMARPLIREPNLPNRWLAGAGEDCATCISCNGCLGAIWQGKTAYCTQDT
jgi:2,4-dienoyl-CoA reductase-like NADH-dependent reductase (Old Yellow Enzyme family)